MPEKQFFLFAWPKAGKINKYINNNYNNILALTYLSSFPLPNFLLGSLKEFPGLNWSGRLDLEASKLISIVIKAWIIGVR